MNIRNKNGFALPTVIITSVVMTIVLLSSLATQSSIASSIRSQYTTKLSRSAAESGVAYLSSCVKEGNAIVLNTDYVPNSKSCTDPTIDTANSNEVLSSTSLSRYRTSFRVRATLTGSIYTFTSVGVINTVRSSDSIPVDSSSTRYYAKVPVNISGIESGNFTTCSLQSGQLFCWGDNTSGQVGDGTKVDRTSPVLVRGVLEGKMVVAVATGISHTCAIARGYTDPVTSNRLYCWGDNTYAQFGSGNTSTGSLVPVLAIDPDGDGADTDDGRPGTSRWPTDVSTRDHTCIATEAPSGSTYPKVAFCWGYNLNSQAGENGSGSPVISNPKLSYQAAIRTGDAMSTNLSDISEVSNVSREFACAINGSQIYC